MIFLVGFGVFEYVIDDDGFDYDKVFIVIVWVVGEELGFGIGKSKKEVE